MHKGEKERGKVCTSIAFGEHLHGLCEGECVGGHGLCVCVCVCVCVCGCVRAVGLVHPLPGDVVVREVKRPGKGIEKKRSREREGGKVCTSIAFGEHLHGLCEGECV